MRKPVLCGVLLSCAAITGAAWSESPTTAPTTNPANQGSPQTSLITRGSLSIAVDGQGSFDPVDACEVRLRFKAYGGELPIVSVVENGAAVKKGDVLLQIDSAAMKRALAAAENDLLAAKATLAKAEADAKIADQADGLALKQQQEALKEAEQNVKWFDTVDGPQMLKQVELALDQAKNQMNDEQDELDQLKKMYKSEELTNATADIVVKRAVRNHDLSSTAYSMAQERANKVRTFTYPISKQRVGESLEMTRNQLALFITSQQQGKVLRQTGLTTVRAAAEAANMKLDELKSDEKLLTVHAPCDGIACYGQVVNGAWSGGDARALRPGEHITATSVLLTVYQPGRLRVAMELPEAKFFAIDPGQSASISPVAMPELKYEGMCDRVPRTPIVSTSNYALTISTGKVDAKLVPGMKATVHMDVPLAEGVILAPNSAIANGMAWVKTATGIEARHVMTGRVDGKSTEILSGLRDGDEVLTQARN